MAYPYTQADHRIQSRPRLLRFFLLLVGGLFLVYYVVGLTPFRHSRRYSSVVHSSCSPCSCDCSAEAMVSSPLDFFNNSLADCGKDDPETNKEVEKDIITLLSEEISLYKSVTNDSLEHTKALIMDAKKTSSHYQREAEKCTTGMETCEETRERAEALLIEERKLTALWENRAREFGWKDEGE